MSRTPFNTQSLLTTSKFITVSDAEKNDILYGIEQARRNNQFTTVKPAGFDPNKFVSFVGYEKQGRPLSYEEVFGRKLQQ